MLYIIATPIGNLNDISLRALETLKSVDLIAAEDTRHSQKLLQHYDIATPLTAYHAHNEQEKLEYLISLLKKNQTIALISDAGTPLISDPGYALVKAALKENIKVVPLPGPCAAICALSVSGLPSQSFIFEGFLPATASARRSRLSELLTQTSTLIFYEAPHRLVEALKDMAAILGEQREAVLARELTKLFETIYNSTLEGLCQFVQDNPHQRKGECVIIVEGMSREAIASRRLEQAQALLKILLETNLPLKQAVKIAADCFSVSKNVLYTIALKSTG